MALIQEICKSFNVPKTVDEDQICIYYKSQYHIFQGPGETEPVVLPLPSGNPQRAPSHTFSLLHLLVHERYLNELSYFTIRDPYIDFLPHLWGNFFKWPWRPGCTCSTPSGATSRVFIPRQARVCLTDVVFCSKNWMQNFRKDWKRIKLLRRSRLQSVGKSGEGFVASHNYWDLGREM